MCAKSWLRPFGIAICKRPQAILLKGFCKTHDAQKYFVQIDNSRFDLNEDFNSSQAWKGLKGRTNTVFSKTILIAFDILAF